jgi:DNA-binding NtrC family response regulator
MDAYDRLEQLETLLVEDDRLVRHAMALAFQTRRCKLDSVKSAEEGLKLLHEKHFDVIISDYRLPGINGITFLKEALFAQPGAVKLLISGDVSEEVISESYASGIHDYLQKPFRLETLWATMAMHAARMAESHSEDPFENMRSAGAAGM